MNVRVLILAVVTILASLAPEASARVFDSETGRWTRRDPLGYVDGINVYQFANGSPKIRKDPFGLCSIAHYRSNTTGNETALARTGPSRLSVRCGTDRSDSECLWRCLNPTPNLCPGEPGLNGFVNCENGVPRCCVCTITIQAHYPNGHGIITQCLEVHELVHYNDPLICANVQPAGFESCTECSAYRAEVECLASKLHECNSAVNQSACFQEVLRKYTEAQESAEHYCALCAEAGGTPRPRGQAQENSNGRM